MYGIAHTAAPAAPKVIDGPGVLNAPQPLLYGTRRTSWRRVRPNVKRKQRASDQKRAFLRYLFELRPVLYDRNSVGERDVIGCSAC
jgi:hypothetical protein